MKLEHLPMEAIQKCGVIALASPLGRQDQQQIQSTLLCTMKHRTDLFPEQI
jgi:hypothetical protein